MTITSAPGGSAIVTAVHWVQALLLGTIATAVATLAVAAVGMLMLSGRIDRRRGAAVLLGCFVIFGASSITSGLMAVAVNADPPGFERSVLPPLAAPTQGESFDPYAGASPAAPPTTKQQFRQRLEQRSGAAPSDGR